MIHPRRTFDAAIGDQAALPLLVLFLLNTFDELDRSAFAILTPEIRDHFGLDNQGILSVVAVVTTLALGLQPFVGYLADRGSRKRIALAGASGWAFFSVLTGFAPTVALLLLARSGSALGRIVVGPTHDSLLSDQYHPDSRPAVFGVHRAGNSIGQFVGPLVAGILATLLSWRAPFVLFAIPTAVLVVIAYRRLDEPERGRFERGFDLDGGVAASAADRPPGFGEAFRICWEVRTVRRVWMALPFLALSLIGLVSLTSIFYEDVFGVSEAGRGAIAAVAEPFQLVGILVFIPISSRLVRSDPGAVVRLVAVMGCITSGFLVAFALAPTLPLAIAANVCATAVLGAVTPGIATVLSLTLPPRARSVGFSLGSLFALAGVPVLLIIGGVADGGSIRTGLLVLVPVYLTGCFVLASGARHVPRDIDKVRSSVRARAEVALARAAGRQKLLVVDSVDVAYGSVQVLFQVDLQVEEGEAVALLGTNGAGKSTLLRAISGLQPAAAGAVVFDGEDITMATPQEIAGRGVVQVPGGKGVFPDLTVAENLQIAGWLRRKDGAELDAAVEQVIEHFPVLRERWEQPAGNLSGGEQQMLTLGQAFILEPRLLMIDELSLGLAPTIVAQLLEIVRAMRDRGTTIIVVEQSVNVALSIADRAYFLEKGEVRFEGPTAQLLERPEILRSVFLQGAERGLAGSGAPAAASRPSPRISADDGLPALRADGLTKSYGGITAVSDVTFELRRGEILGFIGPNGAGKTTLFDLLSGYVVPDSGALELDGVDVTGHGPDRRAWAGLGRSFQDARLFPGLTVAETVSVALERSIEVRDPLAAVFRLPAWADSEASIRSRTDALIESLGLEHYADKFVSDLSTGTRRMVDLACIAAHAPKVILFDEPSSGIAQRETEALGPVLRTLQELTDASLIVIEHDMPLISGLADRLIALDLGRIVASGDPDDVLTHPAVVSSYLGDDRTAIDRSGDAVVAGRNGSRHHPRPIRTTPLRAKGRP
ncbi:MAG: MFS transporter [Acidimicrobiia bacterium]